MNLKELIEKRNNTVAEMKKIVETAVTETRALSDEENANVAALEKELRDLDATIKAAESLEKKDLVDYKEKTEKRSASDIVADYIRTDEKRDMSTSTDGVIIPTELSSDIIKKVTESSDLFNDIFRISSKGEFKQIVEKGKPTAAWTAELAQVTASQGSFDVIKIGHEKLGALVKLSYEIVNQADFDITSYVQQSLTEAFAEELEEAIYSGSGSGEPLGLATDTKANVFTLASQTSITADELIDIKNKVKAAYRKGAVWRMNSTTLGAIEKLKDSTGNYLFRPNVNGEFDGYLLGYPVKVTDAAPTMATGVTPIVFGNVAKAYKGNVNPSMAMQVLREKYAEQGAIGILGFVFFDGKPVNHEAYVVVKNA